MPSAHETEAPRMSSAATGAPQAADVVEQEQAHAQHAERQPGDLAARQARAARSENRTLQAGIVNARITLRPAGSLYSEQEKPVPEAWC